MASSDVSFSPLSICTNWHLLIPGIKRESLLSPHFWVNMVWEHVPALYCDLVCKVMWQLPNFFDIHIQRSLIIPNRCRARNKDGISRKRNGSCEFSGMKNEIIPFSREKLAWGVQLWNFEFIGWWLENKKGGIKDMDVKWEPGDPAWFACKTRYTQY